MKVYNARRHAARSVARLRRRRDDHVPGLVARVPDRDGRRLRDRSVPRRRGLGEHLHVHVLAVTALRSCRSLLGRRHDVLDGDHDVGIRKRDDRFAALRVGAALPRAVGLAIAIDLDDTVDVVDDPVLVDVLVRVELRLDTCGRDAARARDLDDECRVGRIVLSASRHGGSRHRYPVLAPERRRRQTAPDSAPLHDRGVRG